MFDESNSLSSTNLPETNGLATTEAKMARDGTSGTLVRWDGLPNIVRRRRRNFWDGTRCQTGQSRIQRQKPAERLSFVLLIRYDQQESAMIRKKAKLIRYDQPAKLQCKATLAKGHKRSPAIPRGPLRRSHTYKTSGQLARV